MSKPHNESSHSAGNLLPTKLMTPRLHSGIVPRRDLLARLDAGLTRKLIVVSAPTGFGKTTLVSAWIASRDFPSAWLTLDENDNDPPRFWTYVISALRAFDSSLGKTALSALRTTQPPSFTSLLTLLIKDLARLTEPCVLVLEDYHAIASKEILEGVSFLTQHLPEPLHLVLITRTEPDLPLPILRARDQLVEITSPHLRFNQEETGTFLRTALQTELPSSAVSDLLTKTEGWAAGLRLAALSLQNKSDPADAERLVQSFSGSDRYIADYLIKEVFESQSETTQSFLLKTCFLNRLTGSLCDAMTDMDTGAFMLQQLERDNLFVVQLERRGDQTWYRYHSLFAESIQYLAAQRLGEANIRRLFEKASGWYEYHGMLEEAIETALTAKLTERAMALIEKFIEIHDLSELRILSRWLEEVPREEILLHPAICFTHAQIILYTGDRFAPATVTRIGPSLEAAESRWRAAENQHRLGQLLSFRGTVAWWQGDLQKAFEFARQSLEKLPEHDVLWRGNSLLMVSQEALNEGRILEAQDSVLEARALMGAVQNIYGVLAAVQILGEIFYWQGELEQAEQLSRQILTDAVGEESMLDDQGLASLNLAHIAYEKNDLEQAEEFASRALNLGEQRANESLQAQAVIRLAHIHAAKGNLSRARELVKSFEAKIHGPAFLREIQNAQALLSARANDISALDRWLKIVSAENQNALYLQKERETFTLARLQIAEGKTNGTLDALDNWKTDAAENGRVRSQVEALILEALAHHADSHLSQAAQSLSEALMLGYARGFRRIFLDEGTRMAALLQATLSSLPNHSPSTGLRASLSLFATTLLHSFPAEVMPLGAATNSAVGVEPLSQQEARVLRLLVAGLSNADIARELVVSTNTIKTHVKSIYRKLNISSRREAREAARELKLL